MTGTVLNVIAVIIGGGLGLAFGNRLPARMTRTIVIGLGLFVVSIGIKMFLETNNPLIVLGSILLGAMVGEWMRIEEGFEAFGGWLQAKFSRSEIADENSDTQRSLFIQGFLTASLVFCVGPMTILGSIQDGLTGNYELLAIKSILDGFASIAFAASMGVGVLFSAVVILGFQGGISLLAAQLTSVFPPHLLENEMIPEMTAAGGVILLGISISSLLELKKIRVASFLPALFLAPLIVWIIDMVF